MRAGASRRITGFFGKDCEKKLGSPVAYPRVQPEEGMNTRRSRERRGRKCHIFCLEIVYISTTTQLLPQLRSIIFARPAHRFIRFARPGPKHQTRPDLRRPHRPAPRASDPTCVNRHPLRVRTRPCSAIDPRDATPSGAGLLAYLHPHANGSNISGNEILKSQWQSKTR